MYVKKIRRRCGNRGCRNTSNVYAISKTREMGNSIIVCEDCLREALKTIEEANKPIIEPTVVVEEAKAPTAEEQKPKTKQSKSK